MKKTLINSAIAGVLGAISFNASAASNGDILTINGQGTEVTGCTVGVLNPATGNCTNPYAGGVDEPSFNVTGTTGSFFNLGADTFISGYNGMGIKLGFIQDAVGEHGGAPDGTESPAIDNPWGFAGNTGMHQTVGTAVTFLDPTTLDFSGWSVAWGTASHIPMGGDTVNFPTEVGEATITCFDGSGAVSAGCNIGDSYELDYAAHVPAGVPGFTGAAYTLHLEGNIEAMVPVPAAVWLFGSGLLGLVGVARRKTKV